jgi:hypothetical protein
MIHLKIPFRLLLALFIIAYKTALYLFGIVVMFIWYFHLKFVAKWTQITYEHFGEVRFNNLGEQVVYKTIFDYVHGKKTVLPNGFR